MKAASRAFVCIDVGRTMGACSHVNPKLKIPNPKPYTLGLDLTSLMSGSQKCRIGT